MHLVLGVIGFQRAKARYAAPCYSCVMSNTADDVRELLLDKAKALLDEYGRTMTIGDKIRIVEAASSALNAATSRSVAIDPPPIGGHQAAK
jgi:hypothetical protein